MFAKKGKNERKIAILFKKFAQKYRQEYSESAWEFIEENFWMYVYSNVCPDLLMQIYTELGIESPNGNFYKEHLKRVQERFDITGNILDIGSGKIPAFANLLAYEQLRIGKGTITLYEPLLIETKPKYRNMTLYKEEFTSETHIKEFDLITGIMPCEATELVIEQACRNKKDFYVAMCGCTHFDYIPWGMYASPEMYQDYVISKTQSLLKEYDNGELVIEQLDDNYAIDYPILYNRKK
jgi:hypothetical protein